MKKYIVLFVLIFCFSFGFAHADGTITGTLQIGRATGVAWWTITGSGTSYVLPYNSTTFEDGSSVGAIYTCTYVGSATNITSANCKTKTAVVKGYLADGNKLLDVNDKSTVVANLPSNTAFSGGVANGAFYLCNYSGTLPNNITFASCSIDTIAGIASNGGFRLFPDLLCTEADTLVCWLGKVWDFSQVAILLLATAAIVFGGIIYMTSAGNPKQVAMAKKIIFGALTGVAVMVLGRFFLVNIIGVEWIW